ncbi:MAG: hypothetical protein Q8O72_03810 [Bacteroidales bacterium]|nr:hypothetical protein [Bacteroidales bacterium]
MDKEDQYIKNFLQQQPVEQAPEGFTSRVMEAVQLQEKRKMANSPVGDWIYGLIAIGAVGIGILVYLLFDPQSLLAFSGDIRETIVQLYTQMHLQISMPVLFQGVGFNTFTIGMVLIPVTLLIIDRIVSKKVFRLNSYFIA